MYEDFDDLRENCPAEIKADIAIDIEHDDTAQQAEIWAATSDGEFRLYLNSAVSNFWEAEVRNSGGNDVPDMDENEQPVPVEIPMGDISVEDADDEEEQ